MARRIHQRLVQIIDLVTFGTIAHAELNSEVNTKTDEQNRECHRNQVERADDCQADRGGNGQADQQTEGHRQDDPERTQGEPQNGQHH